MFFSKIFSNLLDTQLRTWAEENHVLSEMQFGFRKQESTIDCVFVLSSIINKIVTKEKKKMYCAFVDFKKAFDLVYRDGIWYKLLQSGASSKFVNMLKAIYKKVKSCIKVHGNLSRYFESYMGVKKGEPLSPLLFILFINDMETSIYDQSADQSTQSRLATLLSSLIARRWVGLQTL